MHSITFLDDEQLPAGHDFAFVALPNDGMHIFYRASAITPEMLEDSWAAYRAVTRPPRPPASAPTRVAAASMNSLAGFPLVPALLQLVERVAS